MAQRVIDGLEIVQIQEHQHAAACLDGPGLRHLAQPLAEAMPVGQACQRVKIGQSGQIVTGMAGLGDVPPDPTPAGRSAMLVKQRLGGQRPPAHLVAHLNGQFYIPKGMELLKALVQAGVRIPRLVLIHGNQRLQQGQKWPLLQAIDTDIEGLGQMAGHMAEMPVGRDFPQPVTGMLLKIAQQQVDQLGLALGFGLGTQTAEKHQGA
jgi:hypothetical protein